MFRRYMESCKRLEFAFLDRRLLRFWVPLVLNLKLLSPNVLAPVTARIFTSVVEWSVHKAGDRSGNFLLEVLDVKGVWMVNVRNFWSVFMIKSSLFNRQIVFLSFFEVVKNKMNLGGKTVAVFVQKSFPGFCSSCYLVVEVNELDVVNLT